MGLYNGLICKRPFNNYVDKMREGVKKCHAHLGARFPNDGFIWLVVNLD
jgi:hypothetical protein